VNQLQLVYREIGRIRVQSTQLEARVHNYLEFLETAEFSDVLDFAAKRTKRPNCTAGTSHFCTGADKVGGACVSASKQCQVQVDGAAKSAADYVAKKAGTPRKPKQSPEDALTEDFYNQLKKEGITKTSILRGAGKTYKNILEQDGKAAADKAWDDSLKIRAKSLASETIRQKIDEERLKMMKGNESERERILAFFRLHPEESNKSTLSDWEKANPKDAKTLADRYKKEVFLDKALQYDAIMERGKALYEPLIGVEALPFKEAIAKLTIFRKQLIQSGMSKSKARKIAESKGLGASREEARLLDFATEFYQATNGLGSKTLKKIAIATDGRPYATRDGLISVYSDSKSDVWHEIGHHVELEDERLEKAAQDWRKSRAKSLNLEPLGSKYRGDELGYPGDYPYRYTSKVYADGKTEVISMGLERLAEPWMMLELYKTDPGLFQFTLGVIRHEI